MRELWSGLDGSLKKLQLFRIFWLGFSVKQIIDSLSFLFLLTNFGMNFNEKGSNNKGNHENLDLSCYYFFELG